MMDITLQTLKEKIRPATLLDELDLPTVSYSKLDTFNTCQMKYDFIYNQKKRDDSTTLALELGSLAHKILELKGLMIKGNNPVDYDYLFDCLMNGYEKTDETGKPSSLLLGVSELKKKYWEEWSLPDNKSGMNYDEKIEVFKNVLYKELEDDEWIPIAYEMPFSFVYDNRAVIMGYIDCVKQNKNGDFQVVDYKTGKSIFMDKDVVTSKQMGIYGLAILNLYGKLPIDYLYRFILIDKNQRAMTDGYEKRLIKSLDKIFDKIDECTEKNIWKPSPCQLCHFCNFCKTNPNAGQFKNECLFHSLWTRDNKTFEVNKKWDEQSKINIKNTGRKLVF